MYHKNKYFSWLVVWVVVMAFTGACGSKEAEVVDETPVSQLERALVIGDISDEPAETIAGTQPLADYLAGQLSEFGITHGEVKIAPDLETMIQWMDNGEVDLYFDSPYPALIIQKETGAKPILRRWKYGVSEYHSLFFTRKESEIQSIDDLVGEVVAFEENFSTSGFMLPLSYLHENGLTPVEIESPETAVSSDQVGYIFSTADNTTIQWVVSGKVAVGVVDNISYDLFVPDETKEGLTIIAETEDVPRQLVLTQAGIEPDLENAIKIELLNISADEEGQAVLETFLTTQFDEFPEGADVALSRMHTLYELVQEE